MQKHGICDPPIRNRKDWNPSVSRVGGFIRGLQIIMFAGDKPLANIEVTEIAKYHDYLKNKDYDDSSAAFMIAWF